MAGVQTCGTFSSAAPYAITSSTHRGFNAPLLERQCHEFLLNGLAPNTRCTYASAQRQFIEFCLQMGLAAPCPADEKTLCLFTTLLANSIRHQSIKVYLSAVRALHIEHGFPDPLVNCQRLQQVIRGIKRSQGSTTSQRLPLTDSLMLNIVNTLDLSLYDHTMFWAACNLAYFGLLRSAEFTVPSLAKFDTTLHLQVSDQAFDHLDRPSCLCVWIKASKTDPFRKGCHIYIGTESAPLCAVFAMSAYLNRRGNNPGSLFLLQNGQPLSRELLSSWLKRLLTASGVPGNVSSHSFRIGAATVAARNGVHDHPIQALGRWTSNAYLTYIRTPAEALANITHRLT